MQNKTCIKLVQIPASANKYIGPMVAAQPLIYNKHPESG